MLILWPLLFIFSIVHIKIDVFIAYRLDVPLCVVQNCKYRQYIVRHNSIKPPIEMGLAIQGVTGGTDQTSGGFSLC